MLYEPTAICTAAPDLQPTNNHPTFNAGKPTNSATVPGGSVTDGLVGKLVAAGDKAAKVACVTTTLSTKVVGQRRREICAASQDLIVR